MAKKLSKAVELKADSPDVGKLVTPNFTEVITYDEQGDMVSRKMFKGSRNGKGWCMMYTDKVNELILKCPSGATLKVFMLLAMGQQFDERGYITTKTAVQEKLGITKPTCLAAFKWLKENFIINEYKNDGGYTEYMVNPEYVSIGKDKKKRQREWIRRWQNQTVFTLPSSGQSPLGAIAEPKPEKPLKKKVKRSVSCD